MTQEALKLALKALEAAIKEALEQTQEPVAWISPKFHIHFDPYLDSVPLYTHPPQRTEQEPVAFAGIEMWVGGARITKHITKTEFFKTREAWLLMKYSADWCLAKLKEKNETL